MKNAKPRRILRFFSGGVVLLAAFIIYQGFFLGEVRDYRVSPNGEYIAEWRVYGQGAATSTDLSTVQLKTRINPFRRRVLTGLDYGAQISLIWVDSKTLVVQCGGCGGFEIKSDACGNALYVVGKENSWRDVQIRYTNQSLRGTLGTLSDQKLKD
jgi:hypothetical protein